MQFPRETVPQSTPVLKGGEEDWEAPKENEKKGKVEENQGTMVFWKSFIEKSPDQNADLLTPSVVSFLVTEDFYMLFFSFYAYHFCP